MTKRKKQKTFFLSEEQIVGLKRESKRSGWNVSEIVRAAIDAWLAKGVRK